MNNALRTSALIALLAPALLLGGAYGFQYFGGLAPCEMCWWQRWGHMAALLPAMAALCLPRQPFIARLLVLLAALAIATSGAVGLFHAGVEQQWWRGITGCTAQPLSGSTEQILADVMAMPLIRCDVIPWSLFGISMAGWNALLSFLSAGVVAWLALKKS